MKKILIIALLLASASLGLAQEIKYQNQVLSSGGFPFPSIRVCTEPATGTPCTPLASAIYSDPAGDPLSNPFTGDAAGNFIFYGSNSITYHVQVSGVGITTYDIPNITLPGGGSGGGCSPNCVLTFNTRTGNVVPASADYSFVGIVQTIAGTLPITTLNTGTLALGSSLNFLNLNAASNTAGVFLQDGASDTFVGFQSGPSSPGWILTVNANTGTSPTQTWNATDIKMTINGATTLFDLNTTALTLSGVPLNVTGGFQYNGSAGLATQCFLGGGVGFGACANGTVASVGGTPNQICNTGSSSVVVLAICNPTIMPGNVSITQSANATNALTLTRFTDTSQTGTLIKFQTAGLLQIGYIDVNGNLVLPSVTTNNSGVAGYNGLGAGTDPTAACLATLSGLGINGICLVAPTTVTTSYGRKLAGAGPAAFSVSAWSTASGSPLETLESFVPTTDSSSPTFIQTAIANVQTCGVAILATFDGGGNTQCSGISSAAIAGLNPIAGPATNYTNTTTSSTGGSAAQAYSYTTSLPANTEVFVSCEGSYKESGSTLQPVEFGINFSSTPQSLAVGVYIGVNFTTSTGTYNQAISNGALYAAPAAPAAANSIYPVRFSGGVLTNASSSSTFTIIAALQSVTGSPTMTVPAGAFTCFAL